MLDAMVNVKWYATFFTVPLHYADKLAPLASQIPVIILTLGSPRITS